MPNYDIIKQAIDIIYKEQNPSVSLLRVRLKLSLEEAEAVMDHLVSIGFISDYKSNPARILKNPDDIQTRSKPAPSDIKIDYDSLDGAGFERFCTDILIYNGFKKVTNTIISGDFGVDILCEKGNLSYAIQCKRYSGNVGNKAVQEVFSGKAFYKCDVAIVLTNSYFTPAAEETARLTGVELWNRGRLNDLIITAQQNGYRFPGY